MTAARLIVVAAFDRNDDGELVSAFDPVAFDTEDGRCVQLDHWRKTYRNSRLEQRS